MFPRLSEPVSRAHFLGALMLFMLVTTQAFADTIQVNASSGFGRLLVTLDPPGHAQASLEGAVLKIVFDRKVTFDPAAVATLTLAAALLLPVVKGPTRFGDFSYGTYVLHWPIIQIVVAMGLYASQPYLALALTLLLTAIGAALSWFLVEKPSLALAHSRRIKNPYPAVTPS